MTSVLLYYVHVKCLQRLRNSVPTRNAFYRCPQCGYHYRFARTKVVGIASNPSQPKAPPSCAHHTDCMHVQWWLACSLVLPSPSCSSALHSSPHTSCQVLPTTTHTSLSYTRSARSRTSSAPRPARSPTCHATTPTFLLVHGA